MTSAHAAADGAVTGGAPGIQSAPATGARPAASAGRAVPAGPRVGLRVPHAPPHRAHRAPRAHRAHGAHRALAVLVLAGGLSLPQAAFGHGDEADVPARDSVLQAIALVVNTPQDMAAITDKLDDAKASTEPDGVNLADVDLAMTALRAGDMPRVRTLLEAAIGAKVDVTGLDVRHVLQVPAGLPVISLATGEQAGTLVVADELPGRGPLDGGDAGLLAAAAVAADADIVLSVRYRPAHSIHTLRSHASPRERE